MFMTDYNRTTPTCVTVIGWFWIIIGVLMAFSGLMGALAFTSMSQIPHSHIKTHSTEFFQSGVFSFVFHHLVIFAILQVCIAILSIIAGINFLRLRAWARATLEILSWLGLTFTVSFGVFWLFDCRIPSENISFISNIFGVGLGIFMLVIYSVPLVVIIKFLRGMTVRTAIQEAYKPGRP
jgi:hypothetical protein